VLDLNRTEPIESGLVAIIHKVQRVPADGTVTEVGGSDLTIEGASDSSRDAAGVSRRKSGGRAGHKGNSSSDTHGFDRVGSYELVVPGLIAGTGPRRTPTAGDSGQRDQKQHSTRLTTMRYLQPHVKEALNVLY